MDVYEEQEEARPLDQDGEAAARSKNLLGNRVRQVNDLAMDRRHDAPSARRAEVDVNIFEAAEVSVGMPQRGKVPQSTTGLLGKTDQVGQ